MAQYKYKARKKDGHAFQGIVDAASEEEAENILQEKGLEVVYLEFSGDKPKDNDGSINIPFFNRVKRKDIVIFTRQLSVLISANVSVVQALRILIEQTENPKLKKIINDIADEVESGVKLSEALSKHPKVFSSFFVSMVKSGETSGKLDEVLNYLANQEEKDYDLASKIKGAMIYPVFIISGLGIVGAAMMIFVIPQMTGMLSASGTELPTMTKILIGISDAMRSYWYLFLVGVLGLVFGFRSFSNTPKGRALLDLIKLKLPVFGNLFKMIYLVRFTQSLSTLTTGGVPLTAALKIVSGLVGNKVYQDLIDETIKEVEDGSSVAVVFLQSEYVPKMVSQMLSVGEKTGRLSEVLDKVGGFYSREIENMVANMTHLIEPLIMVIIGVAVGGMVAAIIMPMYQLADSF